MSFVKFLKKYLKDPFFWLFIFLILGASLLFGSIGVSSLNAGTQVVGDGTIGYLAKWVPSSAVPSCTGSVPVGYEAYDLEESTGLTVNTPWTYSSTDTADKCQYKNSSTPSCTADFNPETVTSPGSSTLTWSSQNADDIKYFCTGPVSGGTDYGVIPLNSPASPAVVFDFPYGPTDEESCTFTVKNNSGDEGVCQTNTSAGPGPGPIPIIPEPPTCTLSASDSLVLSGQPLDLTWTSTFSQSGQIDGTSVSSLIDISSSEFPSPLLADGVVTVTPVATPPPSYQDITFKGTFTGHGGTVTCSASPVEVVAGPPIIVTDSFEVKNVKTGEKPKASWITENVVRCDLESNQGYGPIEVCDSEVACASVVDFEINEEVLVDTEYTLTCYHELYSAAHPEPDLVVTAISNPIPYFTLSADPLKVDVEFVSGGATTTPPVELTMISFNGYRNEIILDVDFTSLPLSPGTEVSSVSLTPSGVSFASSPFTKTALMEIYVAYRFIGSRTVKVCASGTSECETITILGKQKIPGWDPI